MPFLCNRLDKEYLERRREVPFLTERPSHYLKQVYVATQPIEEPENLRDLVTLMELFDGEDTTIFASDWPHHDFDHPMKLNQVPFSDGAAPQGVRRERAELLRIDASGRRRWPRRSSAALADFPVGTHRVVEMAGREIGIFNIGGRFTACRTSARTRPARCARRAATTGTLIADATTAGACAGRSRARSSPAPGTASSSTCPPAAASPTRALAARPRGRRGGEDVVVDARARARRGLKRSSEGAVSCASSRRRRAASGRSRSRCRRPRRRRSRGRRRRPRRGA